MRDVNLPLDAGVSADSDCANTNADDKDDLSKIWRRDGSDLEFQDARGVGPLPAICAGSLLFKRT